MDTTGIITGGQSKDKYEQAKRFRQRMTSAEEILWQRLRGRKLAGLHFRRQQVIDGFIADFYCHATGLIVEVDGAVHEQLRQKDAERDAVFAGRDLRVLHFTNEQISRDLESVLAEIGNVANERRKAVETKTPPSLKGRGPGG